MTSQFTMPWNHPRYSYQLEFFKEGAQFSFEESQTILSIQFSSRFREIKKKIRVVDENTPGR